MSKRRRRNRSNKRRRLSLSQKPPAPAMDVSQSADQGGQRGWLFWIGLVLTVAGVVLWIPSFLPTISFVPGSYDTASPFSTPFAITNNGLLKINAVKFVCTIIQINYKEYIQVEGIGLSKESLVSDNLKPRDTFDVVCPFYPMAKVVKTIENAEIEIVVSFKPQFIPFTRLKCARFITEPHPAGGLRWLQRPSNHCAWPKVILTGDKN
jgi:hypothetical protein